MLERPAERLKQFQQKLRAVLSNYLTYPKTLIGLAQDRCLKEEEIQKAFIYLEACLSTLDMEITLLADEFENAH